MVSNSRKYSPLDSAGITWIPWQADLFRPHFNKCLGASQCTMHNHLCPFYGKDLKGSLWTYSPTTDGFDDEFVGKSYLSAYVCTAWKLNLHVGIHKNQENSKKNIFEATPRYETATRDVHRKHLQWEGKNHGANIWKLPYKK